MATRSGLGRPRRAALRAPRAAASGADELDHALHEESGLKGLGGRGDVREWSRARADGDEARELALEVFAYRVAGAVAAMAVATGGLDALVFTAGIGENSAFVRERVCARLGFLGVELDPGATRRRAGLRRRRRGLAAYGCSSSARGRSSSRHERRGASGKPLDAYGNTLMPPPAPSAILERSESKGERRHGRRTDPHATTHHVSLDGRPHPARRHREHRSAPGRRPCSPAAGRSSGPTRRSGDDGYLTSPRERFESSSYAIVSEPIDLVERRHATSRTGSSPTTSLATSGCRVTRRRRLPRRRHGRRRRRVPDRRRARPREHVDSTRSPSTSAQPEARPRAPPPTRTSGLRPPPGRASRCSPGVPRAATGRSSS